MPRKFDWSGKTKLVFNRLTFIKIVEVKGQNKKVLCKCSCGNEKITSIKCLLSGDSQSCGCLNKERVRAACTKHGYNCRGKKRKEYASWRNMIERCNSIKPNLFPYYGGKGIKVCSRWKNGTKKQSAFLCFLADMGDMPDGCRCLDRIDNSKGYYQKNCRWTTFKVSANNQDCTPMIKVKGRLIPLTYAIEGTGLHRSTVYTRKKRGWSEDKLLTPLKFKRK